MTQDWRSNHLKMIHVCALTYLGFTMASCRCDYVEKTRHLASCITAQPVDMTSQVHVFAFGMQKNMKRYCLTRAEPKTLEEAFRLRSMSTTRSRRRVYTQHRNVYARLAQCS